jgi:tetratricopeptide (TPR) repeat protein
MAEARHSLATALSVLRPRLGPDALTSDRESVTLAPGALELDLERLEAGDILGTEATGPLAVAAFLDGFDVAESGEFALWKDRQQARLLPAIKGALVVLIDRCRRTGDSRQIEQLADRMLALDELSEEAIRAKMEARAFAGDRLTALQIFEEWKEKLAEELGAVPSELVEGMAVRLRRRSWERTAPSGIPTVPTDQWRGRPFIGRAAEYRTLYEAWEGMRGGTPGHSIVLGDSGIGKTTLVDRLTTAAGLEGAAISRVQCYDLEREIPYATLGNLIHGLLDRPGVSATAPEALAELARTVPEVRRRYPSIPPPEESQGETARIRLTEAFHQLLLAVAEEHPVILVVDDLHLADDASLAVLHLVMRRSRGQPIMVILIARPGELSRSPQAARLREAAEGLGALELLLQPMTEIESREFLATLTPEDHVDPSLRRSLLRGAGGFPMVMELLLQDWRTNGHRSLALAVDAMTADVPISNSASSLYERFIGRISHTLDAATRNVLSLAAILGRRLNDLSMYSLIDLDTGQTLAGMAELVSRRILRDTGSDLEFVNDLVRGAAYVGVPSSVRRALHSRVADTFIGGGHGDAAALGLEIAWHCIRAGRGDEAVGYLLRGAREARARGALHEAERGLSTALHHLGPPDRGEALTLLSQVLQEQGEWAQSLELLSSEPLTAHDPHAHIRQVLLIMAHANLNGVQFHEVDEQLVYLEDIAKSGEPVETRILAARVAAHLIGDIRSPTRAAMVLDALMSIGAEPMVADDLARLALVKAILLYQLHDRQSSVYEIERAARHIRTQNLASTTACQLQAGLGAIKCVEGRYNEGLDFLDNAYRIAVRLDNDTLRRDVCANVALAHGRLGNYEREQRWARESMSLGGAQVTSYVQILACYCASFATAMRGSHGEAVELISNMDARMPGILPPWAVQAWHLYSADVLYLAAKQTEARRAAHKATFDQDCRLHAPGFAGPFARWLAKLADTPEKLAVASQVMESMLERLRSFDALDRAEILAATAMLERRKGGFDGHRQSMLADALNSLPNAISEQLQRLGFL